MRPLCLLARRAPRAERSHPQLGLSSLAALSHARFGCGCENVQMSFLGPMNQRGIRAGVPHGEVVSSFDDYQAALTAVGKLAGAEFPITAVSIVGADLKSVERVTARLSYGRAAGAGALRGAWFGALFGLLTVVLVGELATAQLMIAVVVLTVGFGALFGIARYSVIRRKRDFASVSELVASRYDVIVTGEHAAQARSLLGAEAAVSSL